LGSLKTTGPLNVDWSGNAIAAYIIRDFVINVEHLLDVLTDIDLDPGVLGNIKTTGPVSIETLIDALSTIDMDIGFIAGLKTIGPLNIEYSGNQGAAIFKNFVINTDYLQTILRDLGLDMDMLGGVRSNQQIDVAYSLSLMQAINTNIEFLRKVGQSTTTSEAMGAGVVKGAQVNVANLAALTKTNAISSESLLCISRNTIFNMEQSLKVFRSNEMDIQTLLSILSSGTQSIEYILRMVKTNVESVENLAGVRRLSTMSVEHLLGVLSVNVINYQYGGQQGTGTVQSYPLNIEALMGINKSNPIDYEYTLGLIRLLNLNIETSLALRTNTTLDAETLAGRQKALQTDIDHLLKILSNHIASVAYEADPGAVAFAADLNINLDWLGRFVKTGELTVDFVIGVLRTFNESIAYIGSVSRTSTTNMDFTGQIPGAKVVNLDWIAPIGGSHPLSVEELRGLSTTALFTALNDGGVVSNNTLNIEYDGILVIVTAHDIWFLGPNPTKWTLTDDGNSWRLTK
jgi:hypothetical protein